MTERRSSLRYVNNRTEITSGMVVTNSYFVDIGTNDGSGGAVYWSMGANIEFELKSCFFINCVTTNGNGGAIYMRCTGSSELTINKCCAYNCSAKIKGQFAYLDLPLSNEIKYFEATACPSIASTEEAAFFLTTGTFKLTYINITESIGRKSYSNGVAVQSKQCSVTIEKSEFSKCKGYYLLEFDDVTSGNMEQINIHDNTAYYTLIYAKLRPITIEKLSIFKTTFDTISGNVIMYGMNGATITVTEAYSDEVAAQPGVITNNWNQIMSDPTYFELPSLENACVMPVMTPVPSPSPSASVSSTPEATMTPSMTPLSELHTSTFTPSKQPNIPNELIRANVKQFGPLTTGEALGVSAGVSFTLIIVGIILMIIYINKKRKQLKEVSVPSFSGLRDDVETPSSYYSYTYSYYSYSYTKSKSTKDIKEDLSISDKNMMRSPPKTVRLESHFVIDDIPEMDLVARYTF